jgi:hypothetical protein
MNKTQRAIGRLHVVGWALVLLSVLAFDECRQVANVAGVVGAMSAFVGTLVFYVTDAGKDG